MCKVFAMSNMAKVKVNRRFIKSVKDAVTGNGKGDNDGFGYSILGEDGSLGGERTTRVDGFQAMLNTPDTRVIKDLPFVNNTRNTFGTVNIESPKAFIGHGRYSTNDATLENTHPYYNEEIALIHNGVVRDPDGAIAESRLQTTNDTELLLRMWEDGQVQSVEKHATGYYALAILDKTTGQMHIVRDDRAMLYISYCRTVDSYIFATTAEIIKKVAKEMKWQTEEPEEVQENVHIILDRNEFTFDSIKPRAAAGPMDAKTKHSLGISGSTGYTSKYGQHSYGGWGGHYNSAGDSETGIVDASVGVEDDEPSYRENVQARKALEAQIENEDLDRQLINDGAPNVDARFAEVDESVDGYEDAYNLNRRIG